MYSSAEWERAESPGPNFSEGNGMSAWSLSVGEPNGFMPIAIHRCTQGWSRAMPDERSLKERAFTSLLTWERMKSNTSSLV